jgi:Lrp/AsnC family leucine-responsive transcriptional regulator
LPPSDIDATDRLILDLLIEDGRRTVRDIAERANLSPSPVKRRIERLERIGVITGYTALVDESRLGDTIEAFAELRFSGNTEVEAITASAKEIPEVIGVYTVAGDPDALVHFRVGSLQHLHRLIDQVRRDGNVIGTKTLMVLDSWRRGERPSESTNDRT